jgi:nucleoside-diphosphate kinase
MARFSCAMETTLILLKPDCVQRGLVGRVVSRFEEKGLKLVGLKLMQISPELAAKHYAAHREKGFYAGLVRFMTSAPVVAMAWSGNDAVAIARKMMGATFGFNAEPGTIRGDFGVSRSYNLIHGSDSKEAAEKELALFFPEGVLDYELNAFRWIYDASEELK